MAAECSVPRSGTLDRENALDGYLEPGQDVLTVECLRFTEYFWFLTEPVDGDCSPFRIDPPDQGNTGTCIERLFSLDVGPFIGRRDDLDGKIRRKGIEASLREVLRVSVWTEESNIRSDNGVRVCGQDKPRFRV